MGWYEQLNGDSLSWLFESETPGIRYLAMRDILELPTDDADLVAAMEVAQAEGPIAEILNQMHPDGYWVEPGPGYNPKYRSTVWSIILLAQLGARAEMDPRIERACSYLVDHALTEHGQFSASGTPGGTADCLQGNLITAMLDLEFDSPGWRPPSIGWPAV